MKKVKFSYQIKSVILKKNINNIQRLFKTLPISSKFNLPQASLSTDYNSESKFILK